MSKELWQLYDEQGRPLAGRGASKDEVFKQGLLHGASHVWIWRCGGGQPEVLLQKRASDKRTWPDCYDISAAGHIDLGEKPIVAAIRETIEEIGLTVLEEDLQLISVHRAHLSAGDDAIENEFQWLYLLELPGDSHLSLQKSEVASVEWKTLHDLNKELKNGGTGYVPHGTLYYNTVCSAIDAAFAMITK